MILQYVPAQAAKTLYKITQSDSNFKIRNKKQDLQKRAVVVNTHNVKRDIVNAFKIAGLVMHKSVSVKTARIMFLIPIKPLGNSCLLANLLFEEDE